MAERTDNGLSTNWFGRVLARRPKSVMLATALVTITLSVLGPVLLENNITAGTEGFEPRGSLLADRQLQNRLVNQLSRTPATGDEWGRRRQQLQINTTVGSENPNGVRRRQQAATLTTLMCADDTGNDRCSDILDVVYECTGPGCHIATARFFHAICSLEDDIRALEGFESCCERSRSSVDEGEAAGGGTGQCCSPRSLPRIAEILHSVECAAISDEQARITFDLIVQCGNLQGLFDADFQTNACSRLGSIAAAAEQIAEWGTTSSGTMSRSAFCLAGKTREQWIHNGVIVPAMDTILIPTHESGGLLDGELVIASWGSEKLRNKLQNEGLNSDVILGNFVGLVISALVIAQTGSAVLGLLGMMHIVLSFTLAYFVYGVVLGFHWFPFLNLLGLFVVLGIGADDIFIVTDAFKQTFVLLPSSTTLEQRISWTLRRAVPAMGITSVTTAVAFAANGITAVPAIRMFGFFIAVLIMCNYLLVITWYPGVIVMHHQCSCAKRCEQRSCCCLRGPATFDPGTAHQLEEQPAAVKEDCAGNAVAHVPPGGQNVRCVERFLVGPVHTAVTHVYGGPTLALLLGCFGIAMGAIGATIDRSSATMLLLQEAHICSQYQMKVTSFASSPGGSNDLVVVDLLFGVEPVDTGNHNDPDSHGEIALDNSFDIADPAAQEYLLGLCTATRALSVVDSEWLTDIERFDAWLRAGSAAQCPMATSGLPLVRSEFLTCLKLWFDGPARYEGCDGHHGCGDELHFQSGHEIPVVWKTQFRTNIEVQDEWDYAKLKPLADTFESFLRHQSPPPSAQNGYFTCGQWTVTDLQDNMVTSAISSATLSVALAFGIILLSTLNIGIALFAIATVVLIVACVMGSIVLMGWELGLLESMCMSILVGMSVDFVVHFAHAWVSHGAVTGANHTTAGTELPQPRTRRLELAARTHTSLSTVGISVLSAGVTTMVAAFVLLFGVIAFFSKFGTMLALAMSFSLIYSLLFFHAIVSWLGPVAGCCRLKSAKDPMRP